MNHPHCAPKSASAAAVPLLLLAGAAAAQQPTALDPSLLQGLEARSIGPAGMSGRIGAVASVPGQPTIVWAGAASGGLWKSTDAGVTFEPVFDEQDCASIGAIAIDPRTPEVVWVGTGEGNTRNSASVGRGVYRTKDGGRTWSKLGLEQSEKIHRIVLHPTDPDTVFVAALGSSWAAGGDRGLFRTKDGGDSWQCILNGNDTTGCCDVVIDPRNPDKLFCGLWDHQRTAWSFRSGGPGSGLFRSTDGGDRWQRIEPHEGAPKGELGRSCFHISRSDPHVVYALVEAEQSVLLRSDDGGFRFDVANRETGIAPRPFYFCDIRVDPEDPDRIYNMHTVVDVSTDGGKSFRTLVGWDNAHPDHHAMWIDPTDADRIVLGNDGGVYLSQDRGTTWRHCRNLPLAQFYHVAVDDDLPYHVYGGLQDNGSWRGPSTVLENGGIRNGHWQEVNFGDGFATLPDPEDSLRGYAMSQGGGLVRYDLGAGTKKGIRPPSPDLDLELRFHWNAAIAQDPFDPATIYYGSQFVHRSEDRGDSWEVISPDLTTNNPEKQKQNESGGLTIDVTAAENHCSILSIAPSPVERGLIWVGTDDGRLHVTRDGGTTWESLEHALPDLPTNTWCPHVEASKHDANTAYAVFDDHRRFNWTSYVYATHDGGQTWQNIATDAIDGYVHCIEEDPVQAGLLFVGTEFGMWFSVDAGATWHRFEHGLPTCAARAITVQASQGDLVVGTHGRGVFIIDDITPLRSLSAELQQRDLHVFPPRPAVMWNLVQSRGARFPGQDEFRGANGPTDAVFYVHTNGDDLEHPDPEVQRVRDAAEMAAKDAGEGDAAATGDGELDAEGETTGQDQGQTDGEEGELDADEVRVLIRDSGGAVVRTMERKVHQGLNRLSWSFARDGERGPSRSFTADDPETKPASRRGVLPGNYRVEVTFRGQTQTVDLTVLADPRRSLDESAWQAKDAMLAELEAMMRQLRDSTRRIARCGVDLELVEKRLALEPKDQPDESKVASLRKATKAARTALTSVEDAIWGKEGGQGIERSRHLMAQVFEQVGAIQSAPEAPNATERLAYERARVRAAAVEAKATEFLEGAWRQFEAAVADSNIVLLPAGR
jgi:photosystem II stability/assembly factor-like uncharacterized protein